MNSTKTKAAIAREQKDRERIEKELLRKNRSRPRMEIPAQYGETLYVHKRIYDGFMKQVGKKLSIISQRVEGGSGGKLIILYDTRAGKPGTLELQDLGPMP